MSYHKDWHDPTPEQKQAWNAELKRLEDAMNALKSSTPPYFSDAYWEAYGAFRSHYNSCPECKGTNTEVLNYDMMWHEGDIVCTKCRCYVRGYDAG